MGLTAENVAERWTSREDMDAFAQRSQERAVAAQTSGFSERELTPYPKEDGTVVAADDGPRASSTLEKLASLEPAFLPGGKVTAGNACPLNDGAAAVLVLRGDKSAELGVEPRARIIASAVSGVDPAIMGVGPIEAIRRVLAQAGMTIDDVDVIELNEAFAAQVIPVCREVGVDPFGDRLNPHGGAIALGHPYGMTGARIMNTLLNDLETLDATIGLETMCVGGGQGMAMSSSGCTERRGRSGRARPDRAGGRGGLGLELGPPFALGRHSFVAPAGADAVLKVTPAEDDESDEEGDALELWAGDGAVRLLRRDRTRRALLLERAVPGTDLSRLAEEDATAAAVSAAQRLWVPAAAPFRWIGDHVPRWLDEAERDGHELLPNARALYASLQIGRGVVVHGDLHHHNILDAGGRFVAIDPKPMLGDPEFDVASFLWNPLRYRMRAHVTEQRLAAFAAVGLDQKRMRAWAVIRGAYLGADANASAVLRGLL